MKQTNLSHWDWFDRQRHTRFVWRNTDKTTRLLPLRLVWPIWSSPTSKGYSLWADRAKVYPVTNNSGFVKLSFKLVPEIVRIAEGQLINKQFSKECGIPYLIEDSTRTAANTILLLIYVIFKVENQSSPTTNFKFVKVPVSEGLGAHWTQKAPLVFKVSILMLDFKEPLISHFQCFKSRSIHKFDFRFILPRNRSSSTSFMSFKMTVGVAVLDDWPGRRTEWCRPSIRPNNL